MNDDVKKYIYGALIVFLGGLLVWIGIVYVNACGTELALCARGNVAVIRTAIPTMIPAAMPVMDYGSGEDVTGKCQVAASELIGAWVDAGAPAAEAFSFTDASGAECEAIGDEVLPLFSRANVWYTGAQSCVSCHGADVLTAAAQLDMSSRDGILAGSRRPDAESKGTDILGAGSWESSLLRAFLLEAQANVPGHDDAPSSGFMVYAGAPLPEDKP